MMDRAELIQRYLDYTCGEQEGKIKSKTVIKFKTGEISIEEEITFTGENEK